MYTDEDFPTAPSRFMVTVLALFVPERIKEDESLDSPIAIWKNVVTIERLFLAQNIS